MSTSKMKLTTLRKSTAPYLPPPLLRFIHAIDTFVYLHRSASLPSGSTSANSAYDEASMMILSSIIVAWTLWRFIKAASVIFGGARSTAHLTDENSVLKQIGENTNGGMIGDKKKFDDTVILCGAMNSGKTCLLHRLLFQDDTTNTASWEMPLTVASMMANVGYLTTARDDDDNNNNKNGGVVRIIDYPGHASLSSQFTPLLSPTNTTRLVFTIDTTQPVTDAVSMLYKSILIHSTVRTNYSRNKPLDVLITCTKTDLRGSKNYKRIKIQIRNEIERLRKIDSVVSGNSGEEEEENWSLKGKNVDLDNLGEEVPIRLYFVEVALGSTSDEGVDAVKEFVIDGTVPNTGRK